MEKTPPPTDDSNHAKEMIRWLSKQIVGMAEAIHAIHIPKYYGLPETRYGRHGDIKPENVLWYHSVDDEKGILVIADLGLTTFNSTKSRSNQPGKDIPTSPDYRGPECDVEGGKISRSYDIWTFGCLLLEMCCWALGGQELRQEFKEFRTTPYINGAWSPIFFEIEKRPLGEGYVYGVKREVSQVSISAVTRS